MKEKILLIIMLALLSVSGFSQDDKVLSTDEEKKVLDNLKNKALVADSIVWKKGGTLGFSTTQTYLSQWAAGGSNSVTAAGMVNLFANYSKGNNSWDNTLDLGFGITMLDVDTRAIKTDDRIDFSSKYGRKATEHWYYAGLLNFRSQFAPGYTVVSGVRVFNNPSGVDARISDFLAPAYILGALGMDFKPNDKLTVFISPLTFKGTIVMNQILADAGAFGVDPATFDDLGATITSGDNFRSEFGGFLKAQYTTSLGENVGFTTKIDLFSNYANNPGNIDVNWENILTLKAGAYFNTTLSTQLIYDHDIQVPKGDEGQTGPGVQFRQVLALGISYKLNQK